VRARKVEHSTRAVWRRHGDDAVNSARVGISCIAIDFLRTRASCHSRSLSSVGDHAVLRVDVNVGSNSGFAASLGYRTSGCPPRRRRPRRRRWAPRTPRDPLVASPRLSRSDDRVGRIVGSKPNGGVHSNWSEVRIFWLRARGWCARGNRVPRRPPPNHAVLGLVDLGQDVTATSLGSLRCHQVLDGIEPSALFHTNLDARLISSE